ncbi:MAG TPA: hypothetical protein VMQ56_06225 [Terracidiphilus sp.]|jgi:hypothetical protein|nr:hypothetical protein [Terracidiphilus sp.]
MHAANSQLRQHESPVNVPRLPALVRLLLVSLFAYAAVLTTFALLRGSRAVYNEMRGAPTLGILHGMPIYQIGLKHVAFCVLYGPLSYLFYLPAALYRNPHSYFLAGSCISFLLYCLPLCLFLVQLRAARNGFWIGLLYASAFVLFTLNSASLAYSSMNFTADAPTLGFAGLACAILFFYNGKRLWLDPALIAIFACCALGCKQNMALFVVALPLFGLIYHGRGFAMRLIVCIGTGLVLTLGVIWAVYHSLSAVYFNNILVPRRFPLLWEHAAPAVEFLYTNAVLLLFALGCLIAIAFSSTHSLCQGFSRGQIGRVILFFAIALGLTPFSIMGVVFWGGSANALSPTLYFGLLTLLALSHVLLVEQPREREWPGPSSAWAVLVLFAVLHCPLLAKTLGPYPVRFALRRSSSDIVYRYSLQHPGEVYFPFDQVSVFFAEHKFYHADWGIGDLILGKVPVSSDEVRRNIPPAARYVAYPPDAPSNCLAPYITPNHIHHKLPELPTFSVFELEPISGLEPKMAQPICEMGSVQR